MSFIFGDPYGDASNVMSDYYNQSRRDQMPYNQHGQQAFNPLWQQMMALMDPSKLQGEWSKNYEMSPEAKQAQDMAGQSGMNAASSMGLLGSTPALQAVQAGTAQIGLNDRNNYLDKLMQKYIAATGIGQNLYNTGASTAANMGNQAMNMGQNMAALKANQGMNNQNWWTNLIGGGIGNMGGDGGGGSGGGSGSDAKAAASWATLFA